MITLGQSFVSIETFPFLHIMLQILLRVWNNISNGKKKRTSWNTQNTTYGAYDT